VVIVVNALGNVSQIISDSRESSILNIVRPKESSEIKIVSEENMDI
jgi:hypothetical protein